MRVSNFVKSAGLAGIIALSGCGLTEKAPEKAKPNILINSTSKYGGVAVGDMNDDRRKDIIIVNQTANYPYEVGVYIFLNNGDGTYTQQKPSNQNTNKNIKLEQ